MSERVLFVDDEPHLLEGIARALHNRFEIHTATSGEQGLSLLQTAGPFALVVSDMRMPQMNGVQFLAKVRDQSPDSVRMILSGQSDLAATIAAVNEGNIFRFLNKPCAPQVLLAAVGMGVEQYQLITAQRVLLEQTLSGAVNMLIEILSVVSPAAYARARRLQRYVLALTAALELRDQWQWSLAASVSQIGCVSLPKDALSKIEAGEALSEEEQCLYDAHPQMAGKMLEAIPRLEDVAAIVSGQNGSLSDLEIPADRRQWGVRTSGRILLRAAAEFDQRMLEGMAATAAADDLKSAGTLLPDIVIDALRRLQMGARDRVMRQVRLLDLAPGMLFDEPLVTDKGQCLVPAGQEVTPTLLQRLRGLADRVQFKEPFRVQVPV